jgi:hypothetical protein
VVVFVIIQVLADDAHFFCQGFFYNCGFPLTARDTADIRGIDPQALGDAVIDASKK